MVDFRERIEQLASLSIARGVGFAALAIVTGMVGMSSQLPAAFKFGGLAFLLTAIVLLIRDRAYSPEQFKRTEIWIMMSPDERPPLELARVLIMSARHDAMTLWAYRASTGGALFLAFALLLDVVV